MAPKYVIPGMWSLINLRRYDVEIM